MSQLIREGIDIRISDWTYMTGFNAAIHKATGGCSCKHKRRTCGSRRASLLRN
jgi:hypothetical protein